MAIPFSTDEAVRASSAVPEEEISDVLPKQAGAAKLAEPKSVEGWASRLYLSESTRLP